MDHSGSKVCGKCKRTLATGEFHKNRAQADGYNSECKSCREERRRLARQAPPANACMICGSDAGEWRPAHVDCIRRLVLREGAAFEKDMRHYRKVESLNARVASLIRQLESEKSARENDSNMTTKQVNELLQLRDTNRDLRAALQRVRDERSELRSKVARMKESNRPYGV